MRTAARPGTRAHELQLRLRHLRLNATVRERRRPGWTGLVLLLVTLVLLALPVILVVALATLGGGLR